MIPEIGMRVRVNYDGGVFLRKGEEGIIANFDTINKMACVGKYTYVLLTGLDYWVDGEWVPYGNNTSS